MRADAKGRGEDRPPGEDGRARFVRRRRRVPRCAVRHRRGRRGREGGGGDQQVSSVARGARHGRGPRFVIAMPERANSLLRHTPAEDTATVPVNLSVRSLALTVLAAAAVMWILNWAREVFIPIVVAVLISYALDPVVGWLMRMRMPRMLASAVVMTLLTASVGYGAYVLTDDATAIVAQLPEAAEKLRQTLRPTQGKPGAIQQVQRAAEELQQTADAAAGRNPVSRGVQRVQIEEPAVDVREYLTWGSASLVAFAGQAV